MLRPLLALALVMAARGAAAGPRDAQAKKALNEAMEVDYLNTEFDKAEQKLKTAIEACGADGCAPVLKAKLYVALGSVLAGGKKQLDDAKDAFIEALKLDKAAALDPDVASTEIGYAFEKAKAELKLGPTPAPPPKDLRHTPPEEQRVSTPVPLFVELTPDLLAKAKKLTLAYKPPGAADWKTLVLKKVGESAFGINVPCDDLRSEGTLQYAITVEGDAGAVLASAGTRTSPLSTTIKAKIDGEPPHWPGFAPSATCGAKVDAGPKQCIDDRQCNGGLACIGGECVKRPADGAMAAGVRKNWVSVGFSPDISLVSGTDVCTADSQANNHFACFREDGTRYQGVPTTKGDKIGDNVNLGPALSTMRIVLGYDRLLLDNLTAGVRVGFAFNGAPAGADFLPLHLEVRGAYWLGKDPFAQPGARPYVFASGGLAQVDTKVNVEVLEDGEACGADDPSIRSSKCNHPSSPADDRTERRIQPLTAYRQAGFGFAGIGVGFSYAPMPLVAFNVALRGSITFPVVTAVLSPEAGVSLGF